MKVRNELGCHLGQQGPRWEQPPAPSEKLQGGTNWDFNILQVNVAGFQNRKVELMKMLHDRKISIALIQETIFPKNIRSISTPGYTAYRCSCKSKCQGIMTLIRKDTQAEVENMQAGDIDMQKITAWINNAKYIFYNVYWPNNSFSKLPLDEVAFKRTILAGDFNAHIPLLGYSTYNFRGREVEDLFNSTNLILEQDMNSTPTLRHKRHQTDSRPDLTLISADLYEQTTVSVESDIGSDHLPILIKIEKIVKPDIRRKTVWNFKRANWKEFECITNVELNKLDFENQPLDVTSAEISSIILKTAKKTIPQGNIKKYKPFWTKELNDAVQARHKARKKVAKYPTPTNRAELNKCTAKDS